MDETERQLSHSLQGGNGDLAKVASQARRLSVLDHLKRLAAPGSRHSSSKVRLEVIGRRGIRHISPRKPSLEGRIEVVDEDSPHGVRHFLARLYQKGKMVVHRGEDILSGFEDSVVNLGPEYGETPRPRISKRKHSVASVQSLDEYPVRGRIKVLGNAPVAEGGYCEVFQGYLHFKGQKKGEKELVAMKRLKAGLTSEHERKMFRRETNAWNKLHHPYILPFYGTIIHKHHIFMISPWAHNGSIINYLKNNPTADRRALLVQIAKGLSYIHNDCKIIHGDVKGANIFVSLAGDALIADFGLSTHIEKMAGVSATGITVRTMMTPRFAAPELLIAAEDAADSEGRMICSTIKSRATDVYAFGMLILQVYTMERPWGAMNTERVLAQIIQGKKPKRPEGDAIFRGFTPFLWDLVEKCLEFKPVNRPRMSALVVSLAEGSVPVGAADLSGEIIGQHKQRRLLVAQWRKGSSEEQVVLKMPVKRHRLQVQKEILQREVQALSLILHPHILPFYGTAEIGSHLFIVTPWMENGDIISYLSRNPKADRLRLLHQASDALSYLHSGPAGTNGPVAHGSLQPECILINRSGEVMLTDFGMTNLLDDLEFTASTDEQVDDAAIRFHSPEFFNSDQRPNMPEGDVFSFAMVMFQVLTDILPYEDAKSHFAVISRIIKGELPERPHGPEVAPINDLIWSLISKCWSYQPEDRPHMDKVCDQLATTLGLDIPSTDQALVRFRNVFIPDILDVDR